MPIPRTPRRRLNQPACDDAITIHASGAYVILTDKGAENSPDL